MGISTCYDNSCFGSSASYWTEGLDIKESSVCLSMRGAQVVEKCLGEVWKCSMLIHSITTTHRLHCLKMVSKRLTLFKVDCSEGDGKKLWEEFQYDLINENSKTI